MHTSRPLGIREKNEERKGLFGYGSVMIHDSSGFRGLQAVK